MKSLKEEQSSLENQIVSMKSYANSFLIMEGEAIYNFQCEEVKVAIEKAQDRDEENKPVCHNYAKVRYKNKIMYMKPKSRILSKTAERIPRTNIFNPMFETSDTTKFVKIMKDETMITEKPPTFSEYLRTNNCPCK